MDANDRRVASKMRAENPAQEVLVIRETEKRSILRIKSPGLQGVVDAVHARGEKVLSADRIPCIGVQLKKSKLSLGVHLAVDNGDLTTSESRTGLPVEVVGVWDWDVVAGKPKPEVSL